jgi:hypothetical protein
MYVIMLLEVDEGRKITGCKICLWRIGAFTTIRPQEILPTTCSLCTTAKKQAFALVSLQIQAPVGGTTAPEPAVYVMYMFKGHKVLAVDDTEGSVRMASFNPFDAEILHSNAYLCCSKAAYRFTMRDDCRGIIHRFY